VELLIVLQDQMPVKLGTAGTFLLSGMFLLSAAFNVWQAIKAKNEQRLDQALHTTETEMNVYKQRAERQSKELAEANQKIGELSAKTDLSQVIEMLSVSVDLSRKFDRENTAVNTGIMKMLELHGQSDRQIFTEIKDSLANLVDVTKELSTEIRDHRKDAHSTNDDIQSHLKAIESKINRRSQERT
jgi:uncharacterized protein YukE